MSQVLRQSTLWILVLFVSASVQVGGAEADPLTKVKKLKLDIAEIGSYGESCGLSKEAFGLAFLA